ncbi:MAG: ABC transporter ATP-binding protein [Verrucomicrobia bacterium]|nr:ABC transporter ATP-binding protein [Verrucomicrobiota bacterium]
MPEPLLQIEHLSLGFETDDGLLRAVEDLSLRIDTGEIVCLVGESGCGKSITAQSIARLIPSVKHLGGRILLEGVDTCALSGKELRTIRGKGVSYIFQDPALALNPTMTIGAQIMEAFTLHQPERANREQCVRALEEVGIPSPELRVNEYPHQLSGGMKQRVMIAMALACRPKLLVADEPTTALDVTIQAQILCLLNELRAQYRMSILLITHNLGIVSQIADRVAVMYAGQIVEQGTTRQILDTPAHPYTKALLAAVPRIGFDVKRLHAIPGQVPPLYDMPCGCRFHPRCHQARPECRQTAPNLRELPDDPGHFCCCL